MRAYPLLPSHLNMRTTHRPASAATESQAGSRSFRESVHDRYERSLLQKERKPRHAKTLLLSIVVPIYNERENLRLLIRRITRSLEGEAYGYEIIFVDDRSEDRSTEYLRALSADCDIRVYEKVGKRGKSSSLLEGFRHARGSVIAMIDGDLQYPPERIPAMVRELERCDIVVGNREKRHTSRLRSMLSRAFQFFFGRLLLSLNVDVQSGLKVFRAEILQHLSAPSTAWGFDYQFLYRAKRLGYRIGQIGIVFEERRHGKSHVNALWTGLELALGALALRLRYLPHDFLPFLAYPHPTERLGFTFDNKEDFLFLPKIMSIKKHIYAETVALGIATVAVAAGALWLASSVTGFSPLLILSAAVAALYVAIIAFKVAVVRQSHKRRPLKFSPREIAALRDEDLPMYSILIPLYKEAEVIEQIIEAMSRIDYPKDKLDIIITLEEYDRETIDAIARAKPPAYFRTLILPDVKPKTKPKALNVAFLETKGEFLVIYDAEIIPDPDQLKKAVLAFRKRPEVACMQTRLDHYNADQNWITKLFNAEFSFHYDMFLPGLEKLGYALPLSGHSTHFRRSVIEGIGAWDPYNLTEDCDMGIRLFRRGYKTDIIDSLSQEEATCSMHAWILQRSRWMKGFIQTSIVHLRHPVRLKNELGGWGKFCAFLLIVPGSVIMNIVNLFYWALLGMWLFTHSLAIQSLFPGPVLYLSLFSFAAGNFLFMYLNLLGSYKRQRYGIVKYGLLSFFYWLMLAYSAVRACVHLVVKPHQWEKTAHGKHLLSSPLYAPAPLTP